MLFLLRMLAMGVHFILAGILGLLLGICRPFNPDNSRLCARLYSIPAQWLLRWKLKTDVHSLEHQYSCVIIPTTSPTTISTCSAAWCPSAP